MPSPRRSRTGKRPHGLRCAANVLPRVVGRWLFLGSSSLLGSPCRPRQRALPAGQPAGRSARRSPPTWSRASTFGLLRSDDAGRELDLGLRGRARHARRRRGSVAGADRRRHLDRRLLAGDQRQPRRVHLDARGRHPRRPLRRRRHREPGASPRRARDRAVDRHRPRRCPPAATPCAWSPAPTTAPPGPTSALRCRDSSAPPSRSRRPPRIASTSAARCWRPTSRRWRVPTTAGGRSRWSRFPASPPTRARSSAASIRSIPTSSTCASRRPRPRRGA